MRKRVAIVATLVALAGVAAARPGGGESYSGGGGHGGGGGGGDIGFIFELIYWVIRLCIYYPQIMVPLLLVIIGYVAWSAWKQHQNKDWDSGPPSVAERVELDDVRRVDPDFSTVVFEDFVYRLFSTAHRARHTAETLASVAPYVSDEARAELAARDPKGVPVRQALVGALRPIEVSLPDSPDDVTSIVVEVEANLATAQATYFTVEHWRLVRASGVRTKAPDRTRTFPCPNCGAPWQSTATGTQTCASCGQVVDNGRFDWLVESIQLLSSDERPPTLTNEVPERGTELPTYRVRGVDAMFAELRAADPSVDQRSLAGRMALIHREVSAAWSKNDLAPIRGLVSDGMYDYLDYWVQAYKAQGLRNVMGSPRISRTEVARVVRDRWYDAVTVRMWATGQDYVIEDASGRVVRGSKRRERPYSEYWTLVRSAARKGTAHTDKRCGNCGAPLAVSMAGACEHCGAHVTGGEFDWVLSKIEQDDSYRG